MCKVLRLCYLIILSGPYLFMTMRLMWDQEQRTYSIHNSLLSVSDQCKERSNERLDSYWYCKLALTNFLCLCLSLSEPLKRAQRNVCPSLCVLIFTLRDAPSRYFLLPSKLGWLIFSGVVMKYTTMGAKARPSSLRPLRAIWGKMRIIIHWHMVIEQQLSSEYIR